MFGSAVGLGGRGKDECRPLGGEHTNTSQSHRDKGAAKRKPSKRKHDLLVTRGSRLIQNSKQNTFVEVQLWLQGMQSHHAELLL